MIAFLQVMATMAGLALVIFGLAILIDIVRRWFGYVPAAAPTRPPWPDDGDDR
jgi:hypothetical protein